MIEETKVIFYVLGGSGDREILWICKLMNMLCDIYNVNIYREEDLLDINRLFVKIDLI